MSVSIHRVDCAFLAGVAAGNKYAQEVITALCPDLAKYMTEGGVLSSQVSVRDAVVTLRCCGLSVEAELLLAKVYTLNTPEPRRVDVHPDDYATVELAIWRAQYTRAGCHKFLQDVIACRIPADAARAIAQGMNWPAPYERVEWFFRGKCETWRSSDTILAMWIGLPKVFVPKLVDQNRHKRVRDVYDAYPDVSRDQISELVDVTDDINVVLVILKQRPDVLTRIRKNEVTAMCALLE